MTQGSLNGASDEEGLRQREDRVQALLHSLPGAAAFIVNRELRYVEAEGEALRAAGLRREDLVGKTIFEALDPTLAAGYEFTYRRALAGTPFDHEHSSHGRWYHSRGVPLRGVSGAIEDVLVVSYDITERKRAEAALRAADARLRLALDVAELGIWSWDLLTGAGDVDERAAAIVGLPPGDFANAAEAQRLRVHPDDLAQLEADIAAGIASGEDFSLAYRVVYPDESVHYVASRARTFSDEAGRPVQLVGTNRDVTAERVSEAALRASEHQKAFLLLLNDRLRPLADPEAIQFEAARTLGEHLGASRVGYAEDQGDGETIIVTRNYTDGVPSIAGRYHYDDYGPELLREFRAGRTVVRPDIATDPTLTEAEKQAHAVLQLGATVNVPLLKAGQLVAVLFMHHREARHWSANELALLEEVASRTWDAVERARAEAALRESEARFRALYAQEQTARKLAEEASRLKDEFLATVSHELRTPLTAFLGYAQLLQRRTRDAAYVARTVDKMVQSAQAQAALTEDLLDVSRIVSGKLRIETAPISLLAVVRAALDTVRPTLDAKNIALETELDPAAAVVLGDANRLQQVVWNLLSNAAKFTPHDGRIAVRLVPSGGYAELTVRDTGQGIAPDFLPFVFDRFRQADSSSRRSYGGLGIGLALVRHLVELHGGSVEAASDGIDTGATFTVCLPLARASAPPDEADPAGRSAGEPEGPLALAGLRALVVDDQPAILDLIAEMLAADGAEVCVSPSAREALALVRSWRPDALVSDIAMPGEDGYWLIEQVRGLPPDAGGATPAIALTAYVRMEDRLRVLAAGFQHYVPKPVDGDELRDVLARLASLKEPR